ncbi:MAG TPA: hypothetical protein VH639_28925 [Bryobacteraceae bacterium]
MAFLRFTVTETLAGRGTTLKEQVIAATLYVDRPELRLGDGAAVRADARRLRDKLREYYAEFPLDRIVIALQKGSYTPVFTHNSALDPPPAPADPEPRSNRITRSGLLVASGVFALALAAIAVLLVLARSPAPSPRIVPLTQYPGGEGVPSLSPDGNFVAFQHWEPPGPAAQDIWIKAVNSESRRRLTDTPPPIAEHSPAWSPDGTEIVFERVGFGRPYIPEQGIFIVSVLGGPERKVADSGRDPKWAPDGKSILIRDGDPSAILQIDLTTLARRRVTNPPSGDADGRFDISPDGATLAFIRSKRSGVADIYLAPISGGSARQLTSWGASMTGLTWTADGRDIVYDVGGQSLWRISPSGRRPGKGAPVPGLESLSTAAATAVNPSISRPAKGPPRLAFQVQKIDVSLRMIDLATSRDTLRVTPFLDAARVDIAGAFSPDGETVLYNSYLAGAPVQVWVAKRDGSGASQIKPMQASRLKTGSWSPDGRRFAFEAAVGGDSDIYTASRNGGEVVRVTNDKATDVGPCWSPDGNWIYYASNRSGKYEIWRSSPQGGAPLQITRRGGVDPALGMDGKFLFYLDPETPPDPSVAAWTATLKMAPADGGDETVVLRSVRHGLWGVTERGILFLATEPDFEAIDLLATPGGAVARIGRLPFTVSKEFPGMTFSRDGRWALTNQVDGRESDLMLIENFR